MSGCSHPKTIAKIISRVKNTWGVLLLEWGGTHLQDGTELSPSQRHQQVSQVAKDLRRGAHFTLRRTHIKKGLISLHLTGTHPLICDLFTVFPTTVFPNQVLVGPQTVHVFPPSQLSARRYYIYSTEATLTVSTRSWEGANPGLSAGPEDWIEKHYPTSIQNYLWVPNGRIKPRRQHDQFWVKLKKKTISTPYHI